MFEVAASAASAVHVQKLLALIKSPLAMYQLSKNRDLTVTQSLPNEPLHMFCKHLHHIFAGYYSPEIKDALQNTQDSARNLESFHDTGRVKKRFLE